MLKILYKLILITSVIFLSSCGFKLIKTYKLPTYINNLIIISEKKHEQFTIELANYFKNNGINAIRIINKSNYFANNVEKKKSNNNINKTNTKKGYYILSVSTPSIHQEVQTYDAKNRVRQYIISVEINYKLFDEEYNIIKKNNLGFSRIYDADPNNLLSSANQKNELVNEINIEIINELIRQLAV